MITSLPNLLTLSRIGVIPALIGAFYLPGVLGNWVVLALFVGAGVTDWLDGHVARSRDQVSPLGRFLDPIADKLLVASTLLMLVAFDRIAGWTVLPAVVILCREILVSGLREFLAAIRVSVPVSQLAKWKTGLQMVALGFLIVGDAGWHVVPVSLIGAAGLWVAAVLTIYTGYDYLREGLRFMTGEGPAKGDARPDVKGPRASTRAG
jgi:cardiolipin synthase